MRLLTFTVSSWPLQTVFICLVTYIPICLYYFPILCSYFHLFFLTHLFTRDILRFTTFDLISLQPARNITEIKKHFTVHNERKSVALIITKQKPLLLSFWLLVRRKYFLAITFQWTFLFMHILIYGSRTFAPEENCLRTLKLTLTLTQTLTLTGVQFS